MGNESPSQSKEQELIDDSITNQFLKQFQLYKNQNNLEVKSLSHGEKLAIFERKTSAFQSRQQNHKDLISLNFQSICKQKASNELESLKNHINYYKRRINLASDPDTDTVNSIVKLLHFSIKNETTNQLIYPASNSSTLWKPAQKQQPKPKRHLASCGFENIFKKPEQKQPSINVSRKQIYRVSFVHEFNLDSLQKEIRFRKANGQFFKEKEIWSIVYCCCKAANKIILQGLKQPMLSPGSIFINEKCEIKVGEWEFVNYYITENYQHDNQSITYEEGETFLTNQLEMTISKKSSKEQTDILTRYYWPPQGLVEMQNILRLGEIQQDRSQNQKLYEAKNSQVFCLAMTVLQLLTLKPYYQKATYSQKQLTKLVQQAIEIRKHLGQAMSQEIVDLLMEMLQWDPLERFRYSDIIEYIHQVYESNQTIFNQTTAYQSIQVKSVRSQVDGSEPTDSDTNRMNGQRNIQENLSRKLYKYQGDGNKLILIDEDFDPKIDRLQDSGIMWPGKGDDYNPHHSDDQIQEPLPNHHKNFTQTRIQNHHPIRNNTLNPSKSDQQDLYQLPFEYVVSQQIEYPDEDIDYEGGQELCEKYQENLLSEEKRYIESFNLNNQLNSIQTDSLPLGQQFSVYQYVPQNWASASKNYDSRQNLKQKELNSIEKNELHLSRDSMASFNLKFLNKSNEDIKMKQNISFDPLFTDSNKKFYSPPQHIYVNNLSTIVKQTSSPQLQKASQNKENVFSFEAYTNKQKKNSSDIFTSQDIMEMIREFARKDSQQTPDFNAIQLTNQKLKFNSEVLKNTDASKKLSFDEKPSLVEKKFDQCYSSTLFESTQNKLFPSYQTLNQPNFNSQTTLPPSNPTVRIQFAKGTYEGAMKNSLRNGYGTFYYKQGGKYSGYWYNNKMDGHGTLYYPDGRVAYQGQWQNDSLHGKGILYNQKPIKIQGRYDFTSFDECDQHECWVSYDGWFQNDQKCGFGELLLSNREKYVGEFKNDMVHGRGKFYTSEGTIVQGIWSENRLVQQQ